MSKVFELISVILGTFIGAGFVGGREVAQYFSKFGFFAIFMIIIAFLLFYLFINMCLKIGNKYNDIDNNTYTLYKKYTKIVNVLIFISAIINVGSMIAGSYSIGSMFNIDLMRIVLPLILIVACYFVVKNKYDGMKRVNVYAVPLIIIAILIITITTCFNSTEYTIPISNTLVTIFGGITSSIIYVFFNMLLLGVLLIQIGHKYSKREIKAGSIISSLFISLLVLIVSISITLSDVGVYDSSIPLLQECININYYFAYIFACCQLLGVFTTIISSCYITSNLLVSKVKSYSKSIIISLIIGLGISFIGFNNIVNYLYTFTGILSFVYFAILFNCILQKSASTNITKGFRKSSAIKLKE